MPYSQLPPNVSYPDVNTDLWVILSRLQEHPIRTVPRLDLVSHAAEFALPLPTGRIPEKVIQVTEDYQAYDALNRPLYDDGMVGTVDPIDTGTGLPFPPFLESVTEDVIVNLRDSPQEFSLAEVFRIVEKDFITKFPFYDYAKLIVFDDRFDTISTYEGQQEASGFASASHPIFLGPVFGLFDRNTSPRGHLMLVAPTIAGVDWFFQIRHGLNVGGSKGPVSDLAQASRLTNSGTGGEARRIFPMENFPVSAAALTDAATIETTHFWIRTAVNHSVALQRPYPIIPFVMILGRSTGL